MYKQEKQQHLHVYLLNFQHNNGLYGTLHLYNAYDYYKLCCTVTLCTVVLIDDYGAIENKKDPQCHS